MKRLSQYILIAFTGLLIIVSCQKDDYELGALVTPTDVTLSYEIVGADAENPNGDGSGLVNFSATATNAITFTFDFGDGKDVQVAADGITSHVFSLTGVNGYNVVVSAVGTGGLKSTKSAHIEVLSTFEDDEAIEFLSGGSSKSWFWAADQSGHAGLGPNDEDFGDTEYAWAAFWQIGPFDDEKECMYDAEFVFTKTDNGLTFEQIEGQAWIPGTYAGKIGVEGDLCYGPDVATPLEGVKNVSFAISTSKAAIDGDYRGTTMNFSDGGFMCWWVGTSEYDIIEVSETVLRVRIKEDNEWAWYHTFTNVKPVEK